MEILNFEEHVILEYVDSLFAIQEGIDTESLRAKCVKVIDKIKTLPLESKKKVLTRLVTSLLVLASSTTVYNIIHSIKDPATTTIVDSKFIDKLAAFKDPLKLSLDKEGIEHIKNEEKLKLKVYKLGDNKLTVGWGHAEDIKKTKLKRGQHIDLETAKKFFEKDLSDAEEGVKRMFDQWSEKGIERKITQEQYNALVSMAFNMGITKFRGSEFIQHVKHGDYKKAGEMIKTTGISHKYPGLKIRREKEAKMFLSQL